MKPIQNLTLSVMLIIFSVNTSKSQYTLDQTLGAPYVQSIHASADGEGLAWVVNEKGSRNIWYTGIEQVEPKVLTNYPEDDGLDISQIIITNSYLFYVRGNGNNRYGEPANPASINPTPQRQILRIRLSDLKINTVASGSGLILSPNGKQLLFSKRGKVQIVDDVTSDKIESKELFEVRSGANSLEWSPDGGSIAFVSSRGDHSFVGYYSIADNKINWIAPAYSYDMYPTWSPDGNQLAFIRSPGNNKDQLRNIMGGIPFEVMVADANTGTAKSIWKSPSDDGGFSQYYPNTTLQWTKGNKILFYSEHEGWNHIYSINPDGSELRDLTPGQCEVENNKLSPDHQFLYYSSNCTDINRRHIWKANVSSGAAEMVSEKDGIQSNVVTLNNGAIAYREGTFNTPTSVILQKGSGRQNLVELSSEFPKDQFVQPEAVQFTSADGLTIHGQLFLPKKPKDKKPAVIFMHGGPIRQMLLGYHYRGYYANAYVMNQYLAAQGYVVLSVNFRDGIGYGRDFRRAENQGPRGAAEYKDILAGAKYLQSRSEVDPEKIGLWGGSYGGYLTAMGLAKNSDLFKAGVDLHGVHDWSWRARDFSPGGAWGITEELMQMAYDSSPISELQFWSSPVLIVHGDDDRNVMFGQSIDLKNKLDELGVYNEILIFPDEVHGFLRYESWLRTYEAATNFFDRFLKD